MLVLEAQYIDLAIAIAKTKEKEMKLTGVGYTDLLQNVMAAESIFRSNVLPEERKTKGRRFWGYLLKLKEIAIGVSKLWFSLDLVDGGSVR